MRVMDVMSTAVVTVDRATPLREVAALLAEHRFSGLPVVDESGAVLGVVSEADILFKEREPASVQEGVLERVLHRGHRERPDPKAAATTAGEAMTSPAVVARPHDLVSRAAATMLDRKINRLPVVDEENRLVGIVSRADLIRAFARPDEELSREIKTLVDYQIGLWNLTPGSITFSVADGAVVLDGEAFVQRQAESLAESAARIPGVVSVTSNLTWRFDEED